MRKCRKNAYVQIGKASSALLKACLYKSRDESYQIFDTGTLWASPPSLVLFITVEFEFIPFCHCGLAFSTRGIGRFVQHLKHSVNLAKLLTLQEGHLQSPGLTWYFSCDVAWTSVVWVSVVLGGRLVWQLWQSTKRAKLFLPQDRQVQSPGKTWNLTSFLSPVSTIGMLVSCLCFSSTSGGRLVLHLKHSIRFVQLCCPQEQVQSLVLTSNLRSTFADTFVIMKSGSFLWGLSSSVERLAPQ